MWAVGVPECYQRAILDLTGGTGMRGCLYLGQVLFHALFNHRSVGEPVLAKRDAEHV